jgi:hypothetical protein
MLVVAARTALVPVRMPEKMGRWLARRGAEHAELLSNHACVIGVAGRPELTEMGVVKLREDEVDPIILRRGVEHIV